MKKRFLYLGLLASIGQLFATGCHPVARWRANHPYGFCGPCATTRPALHPILARRGVLGETVGPTVMSPPCHGCGSSTVGPGVPVTFGGIPDNVVPGTNPAGYPPIGYPVPITPGPTVIPSNALPAPMPLKAPTVTN